MLPGSEDSRDCTQMRHYHGSESASFSQPSHESTAENTKSRKASPSPQVDPDRLTLVMESKGQARPVVGPGWLRSITIIIQTQAREAEHRRLPHRPRAGIVNALRGIATQVIQADQCPFHKHLIGNICQAQFARQNR